MKKTIFFFPIIFIVIFSSFFCPVFADDADLDDLVLKDGYEVIITAKVDPEIKSDILVSISNIDTGASYQAILYAHNQYISSIYVKDEGTYQLSGCSFDGLLTGNYPVDYNSVDVVSTISNHLVFNIGTPDKSSVENIDSNTTTNNSYENSKTETETNVEIVTGMTDEELEKLKETQDKNNADDEFFAKIKRSYVIISIFIFISLIAIIILIYKFNKKRKNSF